LDYAFAWLAIVVLTFYGLLQQRSLSLDPDCFEENDHAFVPTLFLVSQSLGWKNSAEQLKSSPPSVSLQKVRQIMKVRDKGGQK
jgi:hypothetical protein